MFAFRQRGRTSDSGLPESRPRRSPPRPIPCPDAARTALDFAAHALMRPSQAQRAFSHELARILGRAPRQDLIRT